MCIYCAVDYPIEEVDSPTVERVIKLIEDLYVLEVVGGPLHVALDDWNIEDEFWEPFRGDYSDKAFELAEFICTEMLRLTVGQRNFIMAEWEKQA